MFCEPVQLIHPAITQKYLGKFLRVNVNFSLPLFLKQVLFGLIYTYKEILRV